MALAAGLLAAAPPSLKTPAEMNGYKQYTQNAAVGRFLSEADASTRQLSVRVEIFLAILSEEGVSRPEDLNRAKPTILADVESALRKKSITFHEYLVTEEMGSTGAAGVEGPGPAVPRQENTRYSTTDLNDGRNSLGIYETFSFIQE